MQPKPRLLQSLRANLRLRHLSPRTEQAYTAWTRRFVRFHGMRHPSELGEMEIKAFLVHLAEERGVAASTTAQARAALLFLYGEVLGRRLGALGEMPRGRAPVRLPVVLTPVEVRRVLEKMSGTSRLVALLLYGSGMRLMECLTLRVKDLDIERGEIRLRRGKGAKDRVTMVPEVLRPALSSQIERVRELHMPGTANVARIPAGFPFRGACPGSIPARVASCRGSGCSRRGGSTWMRREGDIDIICTSQPFNGR
ncbi:MAG: phage integrase N-terminal SAM-like domain-containing protein [Gemmatimonadaceae bacterium]